MKACIQARLGSTRLPGKCLLPIQGKAIIEHVIDRVCRSKYITKKDCVLLTSNAEKDDPLVHWAEGYGISVYRGDEQNVLSRFQEALKENEDEYVLRVCADNPLIQTEFIDEIIERQCSKADYISFYQDTKPVIKTHWGFFAECIKRESLMAIESASAYEHVTPHLYESGLYSVEKIQVPSYFNGEPLRFTLDTQADLDLIRTIFETVKNTYNTETILEYVRSEPSLMASIRRQISEQEK